MTKTLYVQQSQAIRFGVYILDLHIVDKWANAKPQGELRLGHLVPFRPCKFPE